MWASLVGGLALAAAAQAAPAAVSAAANAAASPKPVADADKVVCRTEAPVGSILTHRVCLRKSEWERRMAEDQDNVRGMQSPTNCVSAGSGCVH